MNRGTREAICRIDVLQDTGSVSRGTGTLVSPDLVLTALHVVADRNASPPEPYPGKIQLTFPNFQTEAVIHENLMDPATDWVLLKCQVPPKVEPVSLGRLKQSGVDWETYGFPDANPRDGMIQTGRVEAWDGVLAGVTALQLFSEEAAAGNGAPVKGLSGAPVFVGTWLVGHMRFALMQDGRTVAGTLYACPIGTLEERSPGLLPVMDVPERRSTIATIVSELKGSERKTRVLGLVAAVILVAALAVGVGLVNRGPKAAKPPIQILGVLPFDNLTGLDGRAASMGGGMRGIILGELRRIGSLRVIDLANTRIGTVGVGRNRGPDLAGAGFSAGAIIEGSILPSQPDEAKLHVALREPQPNRAGWNTVWENDYDVHGQNAFEIQRDVAQQIAAELETRLTAKDSVLLATAHTGDSTAAEFFVLGKNLLDQAFFDPDAAQRASIMLSRAIERDPGFAIAYARLSDAHSLIFYLGVDQSRERADMAKATADTALALQPDLAEGHLALAEYYYRTVNQPDLALRELAIAQRSLPHDSKLLTLGGLIYRRMPGRWGEATCLLRQASDLEPGNWAPAYYAGQTALYSRNYPLGVQYLDRAIQDSAQSVGLDQRARAYMARAVLSVARDGNLEEARATVAEAERHFSTDAMVAALSLDEFRPLLPLLATPHLDSLVNHAVTLFNQLDVDLFLARAIVAAHRGNDLEARINYITAVGLSRAEIIHDSIAIEPHADLALALAGLGQIPEAVREANRALALVGHRGHVSGSVTVGIATTQWSVAEVYLRAKAWNQAEVAVRRLLESPGYLSPDWIKVDPRFGSVITDPGYRGDKQAFYHRLIAPLLYRDTTTTCPPS